MPEDLVLAEPTRFTIGTSKRSMPFATSTSKCGKESRSRSLARPVAASRPRFA